MPIKHNTRGFQGRARVSLTPLDGVGRKFQLGNTTSITEAIEVERTARQNFQESGGGELDVNEAITSVTAELVVDDIKPETVAIGMRSDVQQLVSTPQTGEKHNAWPGERISFKYIPDPEVLPTVSIDASGSHDTEKAFEQGDLIVEASHVYLCTVGGTTGSSAPSFPTDGSTVADGTATWKDIGAAALVKDTDYAVTKHGVQFLPGADGKFVGDHPLPITCGYTANPQYVLQHFVNAGREFMVEIDGENAADNGLPNSVRYFRAKPSPTSGFNRVSSEFASMTLTLTLLEDGTRIGAGVSKYMEERMI
ncbi:MAG: hypothetical protein RBT67_07720 [Thauera sp.]|jgi:hypothetical protein|nr:hypothetical protein [Thauera sp.]